MFALPPLVLLGVVLGGYLLGSIPFGLIVTRLGGAGDLRAIGSGNIGATNVLRTGRRDLALLTLLGDAGKGALAVALAGVLVGGAAGPLAGGAAFVGHIFPVWLKFRGGKGVATFFGVLLAAAWPVGVAAGAVWILLAALLRWSSLAALGAAAAGPVLAIALRQAPAVVDLCLFMAVLIIYRHQENIRRLAAGQEPKIGAKTPAGA
jgi:glycerol-3-phosphate acyltransferase PlsY